MFRDSIEELTLIGRVTELLSVVQSLRIFLREQGNHSTYQKMISLEILPKILSFLNFNRNVFGQLIYEGHLVMLSLSMGNETIVKAMIQEGYLRRLKLCFIESIVGPSEFAAIVGTLSNMAGTGKGFEIIEHLEVSGVLDIIVQEVRRYYGDSTTCSNLIHLFSNLLRCAANLKSEKKNAYIEEMYYCISSIQNPDEETISNLIWGVAMYLTNDPNNGESVEYLVKIPLLKNILSYFVSNFPTSLLPPFSHIMSRITFNYESCAEAITEEVCEVSQFY